MKPNLLALAPMLLLAALLAACGPSGVDHVELSTSAPPLAGQFTANGASVPVGMVIAFQGAPKSNANKDLSVTLLASTDDPAVAQVLPTTTDNQFVLVGARAGTTTLHIRDGGHELDTIPVTVTPQ
ncbi:MAG TPA: hypothetical protein VGI39_11845 [Polyangiaceae bacterium]|jgi:hypothetical protein